MVVPRDLIESIGESILRLQRVLGLPPDDDEDEDEDEEEAYVMQAYDAILLITLLIGNVFAYATIIRLNWT